MGPDLGGSEGLCLLFRVVGRSAHCPAGVLDCWSCPEGPDDHKPKFELHKELKWGLPATVDTLANRLHCRTPMDSVTITMPPFFFYRNKQMDTQLGSSGLGSLVGQCSVLASGVRRPLTSQVLGPWVELIWPCVSEIKEG